MTDYTAMEVLGILVVVFVLGWAVLKAAYWVFVQLVIEIIERHENSQ